MKYVSHMFVILNSSVNILLYGLAWKQFRDEAKELIKKTCICFKMASEGSKKRPYLSEEETQSTELPLTRNTT